jgi:hypothetical protein
MSTDYTLHVFTHDGKIAVPQYEDLRGVYLTNAAIAANPELFGRGIKIGFGNNSNFFPGGSWFPFSFDVRPGSTTCRFATSNDAAPVIVKYSFFDPIPSASS